MECKGVLHFNAVEQKCDSPAAARCPIAANKKEHFNDIEIECPTEGTHFFPHPLNCHLYHICHNGQLTKMLCGRGLYYDIKSQRCELAKRARCIIDALKHRVPNNQEKAKETVNATIPVTTPATIENSVGVQKSTTLDLMSLF